MPMAYPITPPRINVAITNITTSEIAQMRRNQEKNIDYIMKNKRNLDRTLVSILTVNNIINIGNF